MPAINLCRTLTTEQQRNTMRCAEIDQTRNALKAERRALETRIEALAAVASLFERSQHVVEQARTKQARLNPAGLYQSSQRVVDAASAAKTQANVDGDDSVGEQGYSQPSK